MDEVSGQITTKAFEYWGAFGFVVVILGLVVWWLLRHNERQRDAFTKVIDAKDEQIEKWQNRTLDEIKGRAEDKSTMATQIMEAIAMIERMAKQTS